MKNTNPLYLLVARRRWLILIIQIAVIISSLALAFSIRFDFSIPPEYQEVFWTLLPIVLIVKVSIFWAYGLFSGWWRYVSMADLIVLARANVMASLIFVLTVVIAFRLGNIPRSVLLLDGIICFLTLGGIRFVTRAVRENYFTIIDDKSSKNHILIVGAGAAGQMIARELRQNSQIDGVAVGFVDDDPHKQGQKFQGIPILGTSDEINEICEKLDVSEIIVAIPSATGADLRRIVDQCIRADIHFRALPPMSELIGRNVSINEAKSVEVEDLLGREPVHLDDEQVESYLKGKCVLITGAGGSIGSELARQVARLRPSRLVLLDAAETPLFHIDRELKELYPELKLDPIVCNIRNRDRLKKLFAEFNPQAVFHAAAYKHVPLLEYNSPEAVLNNVDGTMAVADAANLAGVEHFVMVSTDKAVNPTNVMGASKRAAELYIQCLAAQSQTHYVTVRFGNVLGSNGSVVPIFREQIKNGGPVMVTHPEITRFFMTIPEASQLVLQAGCMGKGGEIFLLDMGESVKIVDLAERMIKLSGLRVGVDIEINFSGLRPGEKLFEELLIDGEGISETPHQKIHVAKSLSADWATINEQLSALITAANNGDDNELRLALKNVVPEYARQNA